MHCCLGRAHYSTSFIISHSIENAPRDILKKNVCVNSVSVDPFSMICSHQSLLWIHTKQIGGYAIEGAESESKSAGLL